jgi:protein-S-isoprenylcysteine O-methyltransferase Ste14
MEITSSYIARSSALGTIVLIALVFIPAGTLDYWQGWAYIATFIFCSLAYTVYLMKYDQALLKRRSEAGISHEKEHAQKVIMVFLYVSFVALIISPPLDFRFGWSEMPWYISILGDILVVASFSVFYLVSKVNTYAAATVRVEEGQKVVSTGIYGLVRHPMYSGALFLIIGTPLALGSWWALLLVPLFVIILYFRIVNEEKVLLRDLEGYEEYRQKVRHRLIPGLF